jgi:predicted RNA binding protein YcfA (HicA-like mRNA interferase family)
LGKLRVLSSEEVHRILVDHGSRPIRQRGSHIIMQLRTDTTTVTIPIPERKELLDQVILRLWLLLQQRANRASREARAPLLLRIELVEEFATKDERSSPAIRTRP